MLCIHDVYVMEQQRANWVIGDIIIKRYLLRNVDNDPTSKRPHQAHLSVEGKKWNRDPSLACGNNHLIDFFHNIYFLIAGYINHMMNNY